MMMSCIVSFLVTAADWHYLPKFSLTSSQAYGCFISAFPCFKAKYLCGDRYSDVLLKDCSPKRDDIQHLQHHEIIMESTQSFLQNFSPSNDTERQSLALLSTYVENDEAVDGEHSANETITSLAENEIVWNNFVQCTIKILLQCIPVKKTREL
jgi:hypothetical protein